jgi:hypothetical protein
MSVHVMVDIETFGTVPGSVIRSIGACTFKLDAAHVDEEFYRNIDLSSCDAVGLTYSKETKAWWSGYAAAQAVFEQDPVALPVVLGEFSEWFAINKGQYIWSHGAGFDIVLLEAAYRACGMPHCIPWKFYDARDTRTVFAMFGFDFKAAPDRRTIPHHALQDAVHQAICVQAALKLRGRTW